MRVREIQGCKWRKANEDVNAAKKPKNSNNSSIRIPPGNYTELGFAQALDQQFNATTNGVIRAEYDSTNNICAIYTTGDKTAFIILTDEEVQKV